MKSIFLLPLAGLASAVSAQNATTMRTASATPPPAANVWQLPSGEIIFRDYPARARAAGEQGRVGFFVKLDGRGSAARCEISRSSGHPLLDRETCDLLLRHAKFERSKVADEGKVVHNGVVNWTLATHTNVAAALLAADKAYASKTLAAAPATEIRPSPAWLGFNRGPKQERNLAGEKLVCKRVPRTGSLNGQQTQCRSARSWASPDEATAFWSELQGRRGGAGNVVR
jgi:TonB family protein